MMEGACFGGCAKTLVCVDSYEKGVLEGRFYNAWQEPARFESLSQFLN